MPETKQTMVQSLHVVVFPFNEQGHVIPGFALGQALASRGVQVTVVLTATRYAQSSTNLPDFVCVEAIPDDVVNGDLHLDDLCHQETLQKLEPGLEQLLLRMKPRPACLISDLLYPWSQDLADRLGLPRFVFSVFSAASVLAGWHAATLCSKGLLPFQPGTEGKVVCFNGLPKEFLLAEVPADFLARDRKQLEVVFFVHNSLKRAAGVLINTVYELEVDAINALSAEGMSVYAVGPMGCMNWLASEVQVPSLLVEDKTCLGWLDNQAQGSVVYVAFGSLVSLTGKEVQELALGLEACGQPFVWVLRGAGGSSLADRMSVLPLGFLERTKEIGCVIGWAPQAAVLAHASIGCFVSHCGMGSALDALWAGVPVIGAFGKISDQNTVLRAMIKELGVGIALQDQNVVPPLPLRSAVEKCVKDVIHGERGKILSQRTSQVKAVVRQAVKPDGSSLLSLRKVVDMLTSTPNNSE